MKGWRELRSFIGAGGLGGGRIVVGLDFDGTLSPLVRHPGDARLPGNTRRLLQRLARNPRVLLAIVSGRILADIKTRVGLRGIHFSGNHGLEIEGPDLSWRNPKAESAFEDMLGIARDLSSALIPFPRILLEDKGLTLSIHYREMDPKRQPALRLLLARLLHPYARELRLARGKMVWEIRPRVRWNKGDALLKIARAAGNGVPILFVGDDRTDEEGFRVLGHRAVTVKVGPGTSSAARFHLTSQKQVHSLLSLLCDVLT